MLIFDIETDGLLETCTRLFCISIYDTKSDTLSAYGEDEAETGVSLLQKEINAGGVICGHNVINFDIPALEKLYSWFKISYEQQKQVKDTLVIARLIFNNITDYDYVLVHKKILPPKLIGRHSLKAYGYRLGELKGEYGEQEGAWNAYSIEMLEYNKQDVIVTKKLYEKLISKYCSDISLTLEHEVAWLMAKQERNGFFFDVPKASVLEAELRGRYASLHTKLSNIVPQIPDKIFIPKRDNKIKGYEKGVPVQKYKDFNPGSRQQILWLLKEHYAYMPDNDDLYKEDNGNLKMDDITFNFISNDETAPEELRELALPFSEYFMIVKRLGQLSDGRQAWLKNVGTDGFIHGSVNPNGATTGRATHSSPNVAQVPHVGSPYGAACRTLFKAPDGWYQVGIDACGLELRCLAHYMFPFDKGEYAQEILTGDIHTKNQHAAGLPERNQAKTFIYALLYGAGDKKIGRIINGDETDGKRIKRKFFKATPGMKLLREAVQNTLCDMDKGQVIRWKRRYLKGLDGRLIYVKSAHSALNFLLQSAGALICKKWIVLTEKRLLALGLKHGWDGDFAYMAWIHDEIQVACHTKAIAEMVIREAQEAMRDAQSFFNFRIRLDTEGSIGRNWRDCH